MDRIYSVGDRPRIGISACLVAKLRLKPPSNGLWAQNGEPSLAEPAQKLAMGRGLFAEALVAQLPDFPVADERHLADPRRREEFVARVFAHHRPGKIAAMSDGMSPHRPVELVRVRNGARTKDVDRAATEEPLEIRLHGRPFAVIMRTPGADRELAAGFLLSERIITGPDDLGTIEHCTDPSAEVDAGSRRTRPTAHDVERVLVDPPGSHPENIVNVTLARGNAVTLERLLADRRNVTTNSSCGLCGRQTIESLTTDAAPIESTWTIAASTIVALPERLRARQAVFGETGGLHAAGLFTADGTLVDAAEDVGRHNAVDKVIGRMLMREALPLSHHVLCVSGRASFEIVQKAVFAGIPILVAVSAPSSLAIDLARECRVTLAAFVRGDSFNIYAHPARIEG